MHWPKQIKNEALCDSTTTENSLPIVCLHRFKNWGVGGGVNAFT
jgi:hypothetical protein